MLGIAFSIRDRSGIDTKPLPRFRLKVSDKARMLSQGHCTQCKHAVCQGDDDFNFSLLHRGDIFILLRPTEHDGSGDANSSPHSDADRRRRHEHVGLKSEDSEK